MPDTQTKFRARLNEIIKLYPNMNTCAVGLGISISHLSRMKTGLSEPSLSTLDTIAKASSVSIGWLVGE